MVVTGGVGLGKSHIILKHIASLIEVFLNSMILYNSVKASQSTQISDCQLLRGSSYCRYLQTFG